MASETDRTAAKKSISKRETTDPELDEALASARRLDLEVTKENNRHREAMNNASLGWMGRFFGSEQIAPTFIAFIAMIASFLGAIICLYVASKDSQNSVFWGQQFERLLAFSGAALAYIFGRSKK